MARQTLITGKIGPAFRRSNETHVNNYPLIGVEVEIAGAGTWSGDFVLAAPPVGYTPNQALDSVLSDATENVGPWHRPVTLGDVSALVAWS